MLFFPSGKRIGSPVGTIQETRKGAWAVRVQASKKNGRKNRPFRGDIFTPSKEAINDGLALQGKGGLPLFRAVDPYGKVL